MYVVYDFALVLVRLALFALIVPYAIEEWKFLLERK